MNVHSLNKSLQEAARNPALVFLSKSDQMWVTTIARRVQKRIDAQERALEAQIAAINEICK
jgi:hypothetical protein